MGLLGCSMGITCEFCHFPHQKRTGKMRPCKGKRDRYRKFVDRLIHLIDEDPDSFNLRNVELPPSIASNEDARTKLVTEVTAHLEDVRSKQTAAVLSFGSGKLSL